MRSPSWRVNAGGPSPVSRWNAWRDKVSSARNARGSRSCGNRGGKALGCRTARFRYNRHLRKAGALPEDRSRHLEEIRIESAVRCEHANGAIAIRLDGVSHTFVSASGRNYQALQDITLSVTEGSFLSII